MDVDLQFVLSALGAPSKVYYASAEPMLIKKGADSERLRGPQPHFFFNYFTLGVVSKKFCLILLLI